MNTKCLKDKPEKYLEGNISMPHKSDGKGTRWITESPLYLHLSNLLSVVIRSRAILILRPTDICAYSLLIHFFQLIINRLLYILLHYIFGHVKGVEIQFEG
jgi:hypothetical protein